MDLFSKSDPFVVCYKKERTDSEWIKFFTTETIWNDENPEFPDYIMFDFKFEAAQYVRFEVYDRDNKQSDLSKQTYIGFYETTLATIMGRRNSIVSGVLVNDIRELKPPGEITIRGQQVPHNVENLLFQFSARSVDRKNWFGFGKSDPFFEIYQQTTNGGELIKVFKSNVKKKTLDPKWSKYLVPLHRICGNDTSKPLLVKVQDWESNGSHKFIGMFETTVDELLVKKEFSITNSKKQKSASYENSGTFVVNQIEVQKRHTLLDYVQGGLEMNLMVAIDFTLSNGVCSNPRSLHHITSTDIQQVQQLNEYQKAILSIGSILENYDTDKLIPTYGFGACLETSDQVNHCFPLNFKPENPEVEGVDGVLDVYEKALKEVKLHGPTCFSGVLNEAVRAAKQAVEEEKYIVLLILTDGIIFDKKESIKLICEGASLPLSIVIAGVGNANFSAMDVLDGDEVRLSHKGVEAERDIVQFVPMRDFVDKSYTALAQATLEELPDQLTSYYAFNGIPPKQPNEAFTEMVDNVLTSTIEKTFPVGEVVDRE